MRGTIISRASKFQNLLCQNCTQPVKVGQAAIVHTLFLTRDRNLRTNVDATDAYWIYDARPQDSMRASGVARIVWHTDCLKPIVDKAPLEEHVVEKMVADHRQKILERLA